MLVKNATELKTTELSIGEINEIECAIQDALCSTEAIQAIAKDSYKHQNGFLKLTLKAKDGEKFRLHVYKVGATADENIHNHRWSFNSKILCGALPMYLYQVVEGNSHRLHIYERLDGPYTITFNRMVGVIESPLTHIRAGRQYVMEKNLHHKIAPVRELTISYMTTHKTDQRTCDLINVVDKSSKGEEVKEPPLSVKQVIDALQLILTKVVQLKGWV